MLDSQKVEKKGFWKPSTILKVLGQRYCMVRFLTGTTRKVHMKHLSSRILSPKTCHSSSADNAIATDSDSDDDSMGTESYLDVAREKLKDNHLTFRRLGIELYKQDCLSSLICLWGCFGVGYYTGHVVFAGS